MLVSALAAGLLMFADAAPATQTEAPAAQTAQAKPEMKKVCTRSRSTDSNLPRTVCKMVEVKPQEAATTPETPEKPGAE